MTTPTTQRRRPRSDSPPAIELQALFDAAPPVATDTEQALLGAMMLDWRVCGDVVQTLSGPQDFADARHAAIYEVLIESWNTRATTDPVVVAQSLAERGLLERIGGKDYLVDLYERVPSASAASHYARTLRNVAVKRRLIETHAQGLHDVYTSAASAEELLENAGRRLFALQDARLREGAQALGNVVDEQYQRLLARGDDRGLTGLPTGFTELDELTNGLHAGELIIVAGRPSMGKTAFLGSLVTHLGLRQRIPVGVCSLEMSKEQLGMRFLSDVAKVNSHNIRKNILTGEQIAQLEAAAHEMCGMPVFVDDEPGLSLMRLRAKARGMVAEHRIQALFIDYLQLMGESGFNTRQEEVGYISRGLKALARELNIPVVALAQLNRGVEERGQSARPRMSDLRESGSIEQDADVIMLLHREEYYHKANLEEWRLQNPLKRGLAEIIVDKQRNGPTDVVELQWIDHLTAFRNKGEGA